MNKKGFTLIELLVSISIMLLIITIAVPSITNIVAKNKEKEYQSYVDHFIAGAKLYVADHGCTNGSITLNDLISGEYIKDDLPINPKTNTEFNELDRVTVTCDSPFTYSFTEVE